MAADKIDQLEEELANLESFTSPWAMIKKAFSSFGIIAMIGGGIFVNFILAIIFLISSVSSLSLTWLGIGVLLLGIVFPAGYFFFAYNYGRATVFFEAYQGAVKPMAARIVGGVFEQFLPDNNSGDAQEIEQNLLAQELEEKGKGFMDRIPDFISSQFEIVTVIKDILAVVQSQSKRGVGKKEIKDKAMASLFTALDTQLSGFVSAPSLMPILGIGVVNFAVFFYLMA